MAPVRTDSLSELRDAYLGIVSERRCADGITFTDVIERSGVARSQAYRVCASGITGIVASMHQEILTAVSREIRRSIDALGQPVNFRLALQTGLRATLAALDESPLVTTVLTTDAARLRDYFMSLTQTSLANYLVRYVRNCSMYFSDLRGDELQRHATLFVTDVMVAVALASTPGGTVKWPPGDVLQERADAAIDDFLKRIRVGPSARSKKPERVLDAAAIAVPDGRDILEASPLAIMPV